MTTYTIHENAGATSKIHLDGDSGVTYFSKYGVVFSLGFSSYHGAGSISDTSSLWTLGLKTTSDNYSHYLKFDYN